MMKKFSVVEWDNEKGIYYIYEEPTGDFVCSTDNIKKAKNIIKALEDWKENQCK
jgi:hypothetical protein